MVRWDQALYPDHLLTKEELERAFTPGDLVDPTTGAQYGYGWAVKPEYVEHGGEWAGFHTYIRRYWKRRLTVIVLSNCLDVNAYAMGSQVAAIYTN